MSFIQELRNEKKVAVRGDSIYKPYVGTSIHFSFNGLRVTLPLDDKVYEYPETIAKELERRKSEISKMINGPTRSEEIIREITI